MNSLYVPRAAPCAAGVVWNAFSNPDVSLQYGTDLSEPNLQGSPTPGAIALIGVSGLVASRRRR